MFTKGGTAGKAEERGAGGVGVLPPEKLKSEVGGGGVGVTPGRYPLKKIFVGRRANSGGWGEVGVTQIGNPRIFFVRTRSKRGDRRYPRSVPPKIFSVRGRAKSGGMGGGWRNPRSVPPIFFSSKGRLRAGGR